MGIDYKNGSTSEKVYADSNLTKEIGSLNPYEKCECFGILNGNPMIIYKVGNSENYKIGFVGYKGGIKI